jgi:(2R)-sulfolactate sulfo-lyase subunit alpha
LSKLSNIPQFLVHDPEDNVGVIVVEELKAETRMMGVVTADNTTTKCKSLHDIPIGHKVALTNLKKGDTIIKYGVDIGIMTADAKKGAHVHVHNLKTKKW